jgi:alpha-D-ribose 1-methylphosphonate 5-phosphate C-P lyase
MLCRERHLYGFKDYVNTQRYQYQSHDFEVYALSDSVNLRSRRNQIITNIVIKYDMTIYD